MSREQALKRELETERKLRPLEMRRLFASFPEARSLILALWEIINDADPTTARAINSGRTGDDEFREIRQAKRAGHYADIIAGVNRELGQIARRYSESPPKRRQQKGKRTHRKCRRKGCEMQDQRQPGIWTPDGPDPLCQWCRNPLPKGDAV